MLFELRVGTNRKEEISVVEMSDVIGADYSFARQEHRELLAGVDEIRKAADEFGWSGNRSTSARLRRIRDWLSEVLGPHAQWEDAVFYNEVDGRTGTEWSTKLMRYEHHQIRRLVAKLDDDLEALRGALTHDQACAIRGHLIAIETLLRAHMEREERFLFPVLGE
jgi:hemerythrin-like domain-containing protein